ncbi:arginase [soil metagenome]
MSGVGEVAILGVGLDLGSLRRGVDMGPSAIRCADLSERIRSVGATVADLGNVPTALAETAPQSDAQTRYLPAILDTCGRLAAQVRATVDAGTTPIVLGGDHSIAMGTLAGLAAARGRGGVVWIDAHGDLNTPDTTPSGNVHGMPLAAALGACGFSIDGMGRAPWVDPARTVLVGVRQLDQGEKRLVGELDLRVFTMSDIDRRGIASVMAEALGIAEGPNFVHVSFDVDVCDPEIAPGVGTPVPGGLSYREAHLAMELVADADVLTAMEVVEVNPILDNANVTGALAVELVASALGASIL